MSTCRSNAALAGCFIPNDTNIAPEGIIIHEVYDVDGVLIATVYTQVDGTPINIATYQGGGVVTAGSCPLIKVDVEHELLCDVTDADPLTPTVAFIRRYERRYNGSTGVFISQTVTDLALDFVTPYVVVGTASAGSGCAADYDVEQEVVCDAAGTVFVRRFVFISGSQSTVSWHDLDGNTVPAPLTAVGPCPNCAPEPQLGVVTTWLALR